MTYERRVRLWFTATLVSGIFRNKLLPIFLLALLASAGAASSAQAAPPDVRGSYTGYACVGGTLAECEANPTYPQIVNLETEDFASGALVGKGETLAHEPSYTITGVIVGCTVNLHTTQPGYTSESTQTLSADGTTLRGTFNDSFGRKNQPTFAKRSAGQGCGESESERAAKEAKEKAEGEKRPTGTSIICNYAFATLQNTCAASVGDGGPQPPVTPTGTVSFTTTSGGFANGTSCTLTATPLSPQVARCTIVYQTANSGLPSITATYSGDAHHAGSVGHTQYLGGGGPEETSAEGAKSPPGQYPNEVVLETTLPSLAASVEAALQGSSHKLLGETLKLPTPDPRLDPQSATELSLLGSITREVGSAVEPVFKTIPKLDAEIQTVLGRVGELLKSPSQADQANGQILQKQSTEMLEALNKALQKQSEAQKEAIKNAKGSAVEAARHRSSKPKVRIVKSLAYVVKKNVAAGRLKLKLHLNRAALAKLAGKRNSVTLTLRLTVHLSSALTPAGETRVIVKRITLKRAPKSHGHKKH